MFYKEGYLPPAETELNMMAYLEEKSPDKAIDELESEARELFWEFAQSVDCFFVMGPTGEIIRGPNMLLVHTDDGTSSAAFQIIIGIIGVFAPEKPGIIAAYRHWRASRRARHMFGQFYGMAVLFSVEQISDFLKERDQDADEEPSSPTSVHAVANLIVAGVDEGKVTRKADVKEHQDRLGPRKFLRAWAAAVRQRPALSRPGRRPKLNSLHRIETNF